MRPNTLKLSMAFGVVLTGVGLAFLGVAQAEVAKAPAQQKPVTPAKPLTPAKMISQGDTVVASGSKLSQTVSGLLRQATEDADMMRVTCLNDKLTQIDGNLRTAMQHVRSLRQATDAGVRQHEHTMVMVVGQKLDVLGQQASQCVGQDLFATGDTTVDTDIDPDMLPFENNPSFPPTILPPTLPTLPPAVSGTR